MNADDLNNLKGIFSLFEFKRILLLLIGLFVISLITRMIRNLSEKIQTQVPSKRLLTLQVATVITFSFYILGTTGLIYAALRPPKELLLALGGSAAVAIGFALKDLVSSIVAGLILLFDRPFQVGDRVAYGDIYGEIVSIGLRAVRLTTLDDNLVTIPNSKFITDAVSSGNAGALDMMIVVDFRLDPNSNLRKARELLTEVVCTSRFVYLRKPVSIVMNEKGSEDFFWIEMKVKAYVLDVRYEKAFQTDIILRGTEVLQEQGIQRPEKTVRLTGREAPLMR